MSVVTFWNDDREQSGKTLSAVAVATMMAIERNFKILLLSKFIHVSAVDIARHLHGMECPEVVEAIQKVDSWICYYRRGQSWPASSRQFALVHPEQHHCHRHLYPKAKY